MGQSRPLFVYFRYFLDTISIIQIEKSVDGVLGIQTWGCRMVGADETTELWRPPTKISYPQNKTHFMIFLTGGKLELVVYSLNYFLLSKTS